MSIDISKIANVEYQRMANEADTNKNKKLDRSEISIFVNKFNETSNDKKIRTFYDLAQVLGFKKLNNTTPRDRADYEIQNGITPDNVVYLWEEEQNKLNAGKPSSLSKITVLVALKLRADELGISYDENTSIETLVNNIKNATSNTYIVEEKNDGVIDRIVHMGNDDLAVSEIHYSDGRVVIEKNGFEANGTVRMLVTEPPRDIISNSRNGYENARPLEISVGNSLNLNVYEFRNTLTNNDTKSQLMRELNINNETYDRYARVLTKIASFESSLQNESAGRNNYLTYGFVKGIRKILGSEDNMSVGTTALKMQDIIDIANGDTNNKEYKALLRCIGNDPNKMNVIVGKYKEIYSMMKAHGIESETDLLSAENSAIASVIFMHKRLEMLEWVCDNDSNSLRTTTGNHSLEARLQTCDLNLTEDEVLMWIWNGGFEVLVDGAYTKNTPAYQYANYNVPNKITSLAPPGMNNVVRAAKNGDSYGAAMYSILLGGK